MFSVKMIQNLWDDRRGVTAVEYGLIAAIVAGVVVTAVGLMGDGLTSAFAKITTNLNK
jgi:pilus assembly protein Flp/PilA